MGAGGHRRLAGGGDCGGGTLTLFEFAFHSRSDLVVISFAIIIGITIMAEVFLEHLEEEVSAVYHKVLQKMCGPAPESPLSAFGRSCRPVLPLT